MKLGLFNLCGCFPPNKVLKFTPAYLAREIKLSAPGPRDLVQRCDDTIAKPGY